MDAADPHESPPDRDGGTSSSPPPSDRGGGSSFNPLAVEGQTRGNRGEYQENCACNYTGGRVRHERKERRKCVLPADIFQAVDDFKVPDGYRREGCRERSLMYSLRVYFVPLAKEDHKPKYFCMTDPSADRTRRFLAKRAIAEA